MTHRAFSPPRHRHLTTGPYPGTARGPMFLLPGASELCCGQRRSRELGPRIRIDGRWLNPVRASHRLYVSRVPRQPRDRRPTAAARKRWRIDEFIGGDRRMPF